MRSLCNAAAPARNWKIWSSTSCGSAAGEIEEGNAEEEEEEEGEAVTVVVREVKPGQ